MKPASFEYARPTALDEACALLAAEDDARIIAGGQTLVPLMAMRLPAPRSSTSPASRSRSREDGDASHRRHHPAMRRQARPDPAKLPLLARSCRRACADPRPARLWLARQWRSAAEIVRWQCAAPR
jgi:hypothetical protein